MTRKTAERQTAIDSLRKIIKPGDTVYTILDHVSRSGMSRNIRVIVSYAAEDGGVDHLHPNYNVALAIGARRATKGDGLVMGGCGMDMGFQLVYLLSCALYPEYKCLGKGRSHRRRCPSNYHSNYRSSERCDCLHWTGNGQASTENPDPDCTACHGTGSITHAPQSWRKLHRDGYALSHQWL